MWAIKNRTGYAAERNWTRDADGIHWWIVAVRATFQIVGGDSVGPPARLRLLDEQLRPVLVPEYCGEPGRSSLRYDSDLLLPKPGTDVVLLGQAYAPSQRATTQVTVSLRLGPIYKQLQVLGERCYQRSWLGGLEMSSPQPFVTRPLSYELAWGGHTLAADGLSVRGLCERNPVGRGFAAGAGEPAPCIEYLGGDSATLGPAGFGPIAPSWLPRRGLAGTYDAKWAQTQQPLLPHDYQPAFAHCAPADQQLAEPLTLLAGGQVVLDNLTPAGRLQLELPRLPPPQLVSHFGSQRVPHSAHLTLLLLEPDAQRLSLVWQSVLRVPAPKTEQLDFTEISALAGAA